jgi:hypothetical protein
MPPRPLRDSALGIPLGVVGALGFAFVIGLIPDAAFSDSGWRVVLYAVQVPAGPVIVLAIAALAGVLKADRHRFVVSVVGGALIFDGLAVGFFPGVYGQPAESAVWVGSTLLWAFAWIVIAELVFEARRARARSVTAGSA